MKELVINQIVIPVLVAIIGTILEISRRQLKGYLNSKKELIEKQKEALKQSMGIEQYNKDVATIKQAVATVEQLGKEFNWDGALKHSKVLERIEGKVGLSDEEVYDLIKGAVTSMKN
ncbi:phage holin, LLH family [Clostridium felsineum]|uniref:Uncharacterized protein n=1 Tax=Clostridium felsineum TaxID=36839 RepID=A0A1S8L354_9CLOT|nr:phage holin, LLH family [Clostridium felsineum]URZ07528.1 hypothetical protein CLROS_028670 [Clostridium felsineum]URZ12559.1 hypothetical protein CROST_032820 [Clostridium felsineum]